MLAAALALAGCVGDTDPATNVTSKTAQLNAHGRTNDGPASWWWEYSTSKATVESNGGTEVCGSPPEADGRCGPAQGPSGTNVALNFKLTGLTPSTTYWFRACGQDVNDPSPTCGRVLCVVCGAIPCPVCHAAPCANCGRDLPAAQVCPRGHPLCADCAYACEVCGEELCLVCGEIEGHACATDS